MADHENDIFWTTNGLKYLENQFPELKMGYSYDAIIQNKVYQKVSDMFFFRCFDTRGAETGFSYYFRVKKKQFRKKNPTTFLGLLKGISEQKK